MRHVCDRTELARVACEDNRVTCKVTRVALKPLLNLGLRVLRANACALTTARVHVYEEAYFFLGVDEVICLLDWLR